MSKTADDNMIAYMKRMQREARDGQTATVETGTGEARNRYRNPGAREPVQRGMSSGSPERRREEAVAAPPRPQPRTGDTRQPAQPGIRTTTARTGDFAPRRPAPAARSPIARITGDRLFTWLAIVAIVLVVIGVSGVYLSGKTDSDVITAETLPVAQTQLRGAYEDRLRDIESRLVNTMSRVDELSAEMAALTGEDSMIRVSNEALLGEMRDTQRARMDEIAASITMLQEQVEGLRTAVTVGAPAKPPAQRPVAKPQTKAESTSAGKAAVSEASPVANKAPAATARSGDWVINLASYNSAAEADRLLAELDGRGVAAEKVSVVVRGKTMYRVRVPGYESMAAANADAGAVKQKSGLKETWVTRR
jgi:cell division septation protein DedD